MKMVCKLRKDGGHFERYTRQDGGVWASACWKLIFEALLCAFCVWAARFKVQACMAARTRYRFSRQAANLLLSAESCRFLQLYPKNRRFLQLYPKHGNEMGYFVFLMF